MQVLVRDNNVMQAYRKLKKKLYNEGIVREQQERKHYKKPSLVRREKKKEGIRRHKKELAKRAAKDR